MSFQLRVSLARKQPHPQPSKEPTVVQHDPLSLQQSSMNCIVTNLEQYPPDMLALLPRHFRRGLLLLLPPADLFQLEQTKVVEGIDMENDVWKDVSKCYNYEVARRAHIDLIQPRPLRGVNFGTVRVHLQPRGQHLQLPSGIEMPGQLLPETVSWRDHFVTNLVSFLFSMKPIQLAGREYADVSNSYSSQTGCGNYLIFLQLLFCKKFLKLKELIDAGTFPLQVSGVTLLPSRYSQFFKTLVPLSEWLGFLLKDCHIQPPKIIRMDLDQANFEIAQSLFTAKPLQRFLTNVDDVRLFIKSHPSQAKHEGEKETTLSKVTQLCDMLAHCQLQSVSMSQNVIYFRSGCIVRRVIDPSQFNSVLQKCFLQPQFVTVEQFQPLSLFHCLKRINIQCTNFRTNIELSTLCSLVVYVKNSGFESLSVSGPIIKYDDQQLETMMLALESFFTAPVSSSCSLISLSNMRDIPFSLLFWLMKSFLLSPSTIAQKMVVSSCKIDYSAVPSPKALEMVPMDTDSKKSLDLTNNTMERPFVDALSCFPSLVLEELHLGGYHHLDSTTTSVLATLLQTFRTIPLCRIKFLSIKLIVANVKKAFENNQRKFELEMCDSNLIAALFLLAKNVRKTKMSFQCGILARHVELLLSCLRNEWKKNGYGVPLDQLLIQLAGSLAGSPEFRASLEKSLMVYRIHDIARNVDIGDGKASSILPTKNDQ